MSTQKKYNLVIPNPNPSIDNNDMFIPSEDEYVEIKITENYELVINELVEPYVWDDGIGFCSDGGYLTTCRKTNTRKRVNWLIGKLIKAKQLEIDELQKQTSKLIRLKAEVKKTKKLI